MVMVMLFVLFVGTNYYIYYKSIGFNRNSKNRTEASPDLAILSSVRVLTIDECGHYN